LLKSALLNLYHLVMEPALRLYAHSPLAGKLLPQAAAMEHLLHAWSRSHWPEYDNWLASQSQLRLEDWHRQRREALAWHKPPLISLVTPVFNTDPAQLAEAIDSVRLQSYPCWELCLVDDGSSRPETLAILQSHERRDFRIRIRRLKHNLGICAATNRALQMAHGDYVAFFDHDDRLTPDALFQMAKHIKAQPDADILYSDRDMISEQGQRHMFLFKPGWSPETLLSGNYAFHLMVYRRTLLEQLGGVDARYEGSQDYDLLLRASELLPKVIHIPKVLYSWRQHYHSVSLNPAHKEGAFLSGLAALKGTIERRKLRGSVEEIDHLWRGNYRVQLEAPRRWRIGLLQLNSLTQACDYGRKVNQYFQATPCDALVVLGPGVTPHNEAIDELVSWLQIEAVGMTSGKILDTGGQLLHAGLLFAPDGSLVSPYRGQPETEPGYMAMTTVNRNISTPHPFCVAIRHSFWQALGGMDSNLFSGPYALHNLALQGLAQGHRFVYTAFARFVTQQSWPDAEIWVEQERSLFAQRHAKILGRHDPYFSPWLRFDQGIHPDLLND
jgi:glycosyltransferase involved in cell wall biosynthesis